MPILHVTARGQITLRQEILNHLGLKPGDKVQVELLPGGTGLIKAAAPTGNIKNFIGFLAKPERTSVSIEEIGRSAEDGWAGEWH
jgi:bifunctional DNA-binding transcriptional regulator/antitoxin component of YhaV-PrlF toxin-antitoxin module